MRYEKPLSNENEKNKKPHRVSYINYNF